MKVYKNRSIEFRTLFISPIFPSPNNSSSRKNWIRSSIPEGVQDGTVLRQIMSLNAPLRIKRTQFVTREIKVSSHRWIRTRGGFFSVTGRGDPLPPLLLYRCPMPARQPTRCNIFPPNREAQP